MNKSFIFLFLTILLSGCGKKDYPVEPNQVPAGTVGKLYNQKIDVSGGVVIPYTVQITTDFKEDMGVVVKPINQDVSDAYNHLVIYGVPKYSGDFKIKISGGIYGSGDGKFTKEYTYKVNSK